MSKYWSPITASLTPYVPGEQPKDKQYIKINTNENPYPPSPRVLEAITEAANGDLRLYPDPTCEQLNRTIAEYYGLKESQVFTGNGSDEILAFAFVGLFDPAKPVRFPDITYSFYKVYAKLYGISYELVPLDEQFNIPLEQLSNSPGGVIIPNPNAPTAKYVSLDALRAVLDSNSEQVVIIDEAYIDFGGESAVQLIEEYPNLLVIQTLSKSRSLAGLRVGFALGNEELIEGLNRIKNSFNSYTMDRLALAGATAAIQDQAYFEQTRQSVIRTREWTTEQLEKLGFTVIDSKANFVFATHPEQEAKQLFQALRERGILVRYFDQPRINAYLRISMGTDEEMSAFIDAMSAILTDR